LRQPFIVDTHYRYRVVNEERNLKNIILEFFKPTQNPKDGNQNHIKATSYYPNRMTRVLNVNTVDVFQKEKDENECEWHRYPLVLPASVYH
jgi:hypothetical protein